MSSFPLKHCLMQAKRSLSTDSAASLKAYLRAHPDLQAKYTDLTQTLGAAANVGPGNKSRLLPGLHSTFQKQTAELIASVKALDIDKRPESLALSCLTGCTCSRKTRGKAAWDFTSKASTGQCMIYNAFLSSTFKSPTPTAENALTVTSRPSAEYVDWLEAGKPEQDWRAEIFKQHHDTLFSNLANFQPGLDLDAVYASLEEQHVVAKAQASAPAATSDSAAETLPWQELASMSWDERKDSFPHCICDRSISKLRFLDECQEWQKARKARSTSTVDPSRAYDAEADDKDFLWRTEGRPKIDESTPDDWEAAFDQGE